MTAFFLYSLKSAFVLSLLYLPYMWLLRKETFFRLNRYVLLGTLGLSLVLPLLHLSFFSLGAFGFLHLFPQQLIEVGRPVQVSSAAASTTSPAVMDGVGSGTSLGQDWAEMLSPSHLSFWAMLYLVVLIALLLWRVGQILHMQRTIRQGTLWTSVEEGMTIHCHAEEVAPFSWMRHVVISERDYAEGGHAILLHEKAHILCRHSWDILTLILLQTLQWWNPFVYLLGWSLRDVHEFQADDYVLRQGVSAQTYQLLLVKKAIGAGASTYANSFQHSLTKKRITMMNQAKSNRWRYGRALYVIPMMCVALCAFATPQMPQDTSAPVVQTAPVADAPMLVSNTGALVPNVDVPEAGVHMLVPNPTYDVVDELPTFGTGEADIYKYLSQHVRYPKAALDGGVQGRCMVKFTIDEQGKPVDVMVVSVDGTKNKNYKSSIEQIIVTAYHKQIDAAQDASVKERLRKQLAGKQAIMAEAKRVIQGMPAWKPGRLKGKNGKMQVVRTSMTLPITFRLQ